MFAIPFILMNAQVTGDDFNPVLVVGWYGGLSLIWGVVLSYAFRRLWEGETLALSVAEVYAQKKGATFATPLLVLSKH